MLWLKTFARNVLDIKTFCRPSFRQITGNCRGGNPVPRILIGCICVLALVATANAQSFSHYEGEYGAPGASIAAPGPNSITQSLDTLTISPVNSVSCNAGGLHADNSYMRRFFLAADHGIVNAFSVNSLDWAIEVATGSGGSQPVDVNVYSIPSGAPLTFANLTLEGSSSIAVSDATQAGINTAVAGAIVDPTTMDLVVEVFTPNGQASGNSFFIGSNANGETQPSYIAAADCGISEPATTGSIGFSGMQIIMVVNGIEGGGVPTMGGWAMILMAVLLTAIAFWVQRRRSAPFSV